METLSRIEHFLSKSPGAVPPIRFCKYLGFEKHSESMKRTPIEAALWNIVMGAVADYLEHGRENIEKVDLSFDIRAFPVSKDIDFVER